MPSIWVMVVLMLVTIVIYSLYLSQAYALKGGNGGMGGVQPPPPPSPPPKVDQGDPTASGEGDLGLNRGQIYDMDLWSFHPASSNPLQD